MGRQRVGALRQMSEEVSLLPATRPASRGFGKGVVKLLLPGAQEAEVVHLVLERGGVLLVSGGLSIGNHGGQARVRAGRDAE